MKSFFFRKMLLSEDDYVHLKTKIKSLFCLYSYRKFFLVLVLKVKNEKQSNSRKNIHMIIIVAI